MNEIADVRAATDEVVRSKASAEKSHRLKRKHLSEIRVFHAEHYYLFSFVVSW